MQVIDDMRSEEGGIIPTWEKYVSMTVGVTAVAIVSVL